ncbi:MAG: substrate binding domain-containing protein [Deltaproteobacteria bacterium]|nr:substrate binding domain-containing protein [Deltaproteobacteria bacterium]
MSVRRLDEVPRGLLRVSTTSTILDEMLVQFLVDFPEVQLEVLESTRQVDLVGEGIDVAIRFGPVLDPNLIVRRVGSVKRLVAGSPAYFELRGHPATPGDLSEHACLVSFAGDDTPNRTWPLSTGGSVSVTGPMSGNAGRLLRKAALAGRGLVFLPVPFIADDLASGELVPVLEQSVSAATSMSVVFADREYIDPKVRAFVDRAVQVLETAFATSTAGEDQPARGA